jgi:hypothetical protein
MEREAIHAFFLDDSGEIDTPACREYIMQGFEQASDGRLICQRMYAKLEDTEFRLVETRTK